MEGELRKKIRDWLVGKEGKPFELYNQIAAEFNILPSYAKNILYRIQKKDGKQFESNTRRTYDEPVQHGYTAPVLQSEKTNIDAGTKEITLLFDRALSKEEIEKELKIDNINTRIINYWNKLVNSGKGYSISVYVKNISQEYNQTTVDRLLSEFTAKYRHPEIKPSEKNLLILNITDFHLDKKDIGENDIEKKILDYVAHIRFILECARLHGIDRILYVVGSDYFNTDNIFGQTTKGTPQENSMSWDQAFMIGFDLQVTVFKLLQSYCSNVDVMLVSGNHDNTKAFYLAYSLSKYFETSGINFMINTSPRKQYTFGNTFFCLHHGDTNIEKLPLNSSVEFGQQWGAAKYREIITGDKHHYKQIEKEGVRMHGLPSLSGTDTWHNNQHYQNSIRAAIGLMYGYEKGKFLEFESR